MVLAIMFVLAFALGVGAAFAGLLVWEQREARESERRVRDYVADFDRLWGSARGAFAGVPRDANGTPDPVGFSWVEPGLPVVESTTRDDEKTTHWVRT